MEQEAQQQNQKEEAPAHTQPGKEDQMLEALINAVKQKKFKLGIKLHHYTLSVCLSLFSLATGKQFKRDSA